MTKNRRVDLNKILDYLAIGILSFVCTIAMVTFLLAVWVVSPAVAVMTAIVFWSTYRVWNRKK